MTGTSLFHEQTARQRIAAVVDAGSFVELLPPPERLTSPYLAQLGIPVSFDDGIVIGKAKIGGKKLYIAAQVGQFVGGAVGEIHGAKLTGLFKAAARDRVPCALIIESGGVRLHEGSAGEIAITETMRGELTRSQVEAARQDILGRYRSDGYLLTGVTLADGGGGRVRFVVTEGHIAEVKLDGDIGPAGTQILRFLNRLTEKRPIDSATLERALLLAQDVPGVSLRAVLRPSTEAPGALTLIAQVQRTPWGATIVADNRGGASTIVGPSSRRSRCTVSGLSGQLMVAPATSATPSEKIASPTQAIGRKASQLSPRSTRSSLV